MKIRLFLLAVLGLAFSVSAFAVPLTFTCDLNPPEEQVTEYRLYLQIGTGTPTLITTTPAPPWPSVNVTPIKDGKILATAYSGFWKMESGYSVPVLLPPPAAPPASLRKQ